MDLPSDPSGSDFRPRFCPRCRKDGRGESNLCRDCGETLIPQGYCAVCESFRPLVPGTSCPKHDVALEAWEPGLLGTQTHANDQAWVTVQSFLDASRAEAPRIRLEAEGIPTFLEGERMGSSTMYQVATGGVKLQVPESLLADARVLLAQDWSPVVYEDDDLDDAWDDLDPEIGSTWSGLILAVVSFVLLAPVLLTLFFLWLNAR